MVDVLHINDNNLVVESAGKPFFSRGYAWLKGNDVIFDISGGESPLSHCRLAPQQMNNRYWQQCEQSAIPSNGAGMRHAADLVWQHLGQLKQQRDLHDLVVVVPSHYRESNLQLLLGIAKAHQLEIKGLVNKPVVALQSQVAKEGEYWHFDVQLHQTVCSRVEVSNGLLKLGDVEVLSDVGIHLMQEALLKGLQNNFIQNDRFDPLHDAATEQQLFDQLGSIALQLAQSGKASIGLEHQSRLHNSTLDSKEWHALLQPFSDRLLQLSRNADASYVDLNSAFDGAGLDLLSDAGITHLIEPTVYSLDQLIQESNSGSIIYKTDLPIMVSRNSDQREVHDNEEVDAKHVEVTRSLPKVTDTDSGSTEATHLLNGGKAVPISTAKLNTENGLLALTQGQGDVQALLESGKLFILNDEGRTQLRVNDRLGSHLADGIVTVIQVL